VGDGRAEGRWEFWIDRGGTFTLGTTVATNDLLERRGEPCVLGDRGHRARRSASVRVRTRADV